MLCCSTLCDIYAFTVPVLGIVQHGISLVQLFRIEGVLEFVRESRSI